MVYSVIARPASFSTPRQSPPASGFSHATKGPTKERGYRARHGQTLFNDAHKMGKLADRIHRELANEEIEDDGMPFEEKMAELSSELYEQMAEAGELDAAIRRNLETLGYGE